MVGQLADAGAGGLGVPLGSQGVQQERQHTPLWTLKATQLLGAAAFACFGRYITVYYAEIGLSRNAIGVLQFVAPFASFAGQLFWGAVTDQLGEFKRTLVGTQVFGTMVIFCYMLPAVQESFALVLVVTILWCFLLSTSGPLIDAMCLIVLSEQNVIDEAYGDQRLWCAVGWGGMALIAGQLIDVLGLKFMFFGFAAIQSANITIIAIWLPQPEKRQGAAATACREAEGGGEEAHVRLCTCEVLWFFANLLQYGIAMSLIESFLFVFLLQDFQGTPKVLLGASTAVMCVFEVPVFKYIARVWQGPGRSSRLTSVLLACQLILALRCWLYTVLPPEWPWLVLLVEPLHGICFAAMWAVSVEYAQRLSPPGAVARLQALVNGIYYNVAMGTGSVVWGVVAENSPKGIGFERSFLLDAAFVLAWSLIWQAGLVVLGRRKQRSRIVRACGERLAAELEERCGGAEAQA